MADEIFTSPRLAGLYDALDPHRDDLDAYLDMVGEFGARSVLDVGCGTGTLVFEVRDPQSRAAERSPCRIRP